MVKSKKSKKDHLIVLVSMMALLVSVQTVFQPIHAITHLERSPASQPFPRHPRLRDEEEILEKYQDYLVFVLSIARVSQPSLAASLSEQFKRLEKESPSNAARFLRGLKIELDQKVELLGVPQQRFSSAHPQLRPWVAHFLPIWLREVDEARFRSYTDKLIAKRQQQAE